MIVLKIGVYNIPLPADSQLVRDFETNIFDRDLKGTDFTYPVELALSDEVIAAFGLPHIVANPNIKRDYDAQLIVDGLFITTVTVHLLETNLEQKKITFSLIGDYGSIGKLLGDKKVNELLLDGIRTIGAVMPDSHYMAFAENSGVTTGLIWYQPCDVETHLSDVANGIVAADYAFPMAIDINANLDVIHRDSAYQEKVDGLQPDYRSIINPYYWIDASTKGYRDPVKEYLTLMLGDGKELTRDRQFWVPMFKLSYVLKKCFEEFGFTVSGAILTDARFLEKLIYNTYAINKVYISEQTVPTTGGERYEGYVTHDATTIQPRNHVPDMKIIDFLSEVGKWFNLQYLIDFTNRTVELRMLKDLVPGTNVIDLSPYALPDPSIIFEDDKYNNGYEFSFADDDNNQVTGELKDDIADYNYRGEVENWWSLDPGNPTPPFSSPVTGDLCYMKSEDAYFMYSGSQWDFYTHNLIKYKTSTKDNLAKIESLMRPPVMYRHWNLGMMDNPTGWFGTHRGAKYFHNMLLPISNMGIEGDNLLGISAPGYYNLDGLSYLSAAGGILYRVTGRIKKANTVLLNYLGFQEVMSGDPALYPFATSTKYDANGDLIGTSVSAWHNPMNDGLFHNFWDGMVSTLAKSVHVKYKILMDVATYQKLKPDDNFIKINGLYFLCTKGTIPMPFPSMVELTLAKL